MNRRIPRLLVAITCAALAVSNLHLLAVHGRGPHLTGTEDLADARLLLLGAALALVWIQPGLWHGKRNAALIAGGAALLSLIGGDTFLLGRRAVIVALLFASLIGFHRSFAGRADPAHLRDGMRLLVVGMSVMLIYGTATIYLLDRYFRTSTALGESTLVALRLMALLPAGSVRAINPHGRWVIASVHLGSLIVIFVALTRFIAAVTLDRRERDQVHVAALLDRWATVPLAHFHLLDDKSWMFAADGESFIGYTVVGSTAVALSDPIGPPGQAAAMFAQFVRHCERHGWTLAFHQLTPAGAAAAERAGLRTLKIGEEAIVDVRSWDLDAPNHKSLRSAVRRIERAGLSLVELAQPLSDEDVAQLGEVSDSWMSSDDHRERTFTLGRFDPDYLRSTRVLALRDETTQRIAAFVNIIPSYRSDIGNFDLMRRRPDSPNGTMDYLFVKLIELFRGEGFTGMTLGFAPLSNITGDQLSARALRTLYQRGGKAFNFQGLRAFKDKWSPSWEPRSLAYQTGADLPVVALAISRAGELNRHHTTAGRAVSVVRRYPVASSLGAILTWFGVVTTVSPRSRRVLMRYLGFAPRDLRRMELWRFPTSQLVPAASSTMLLGVAITVAVLFIAEWRIGSRMAALVFFVCDWISTLIVLGITEIIQLTRGGMDRVFQVRDGGSSVGMWALIIASILSVTATRPRRWLLAAATAVLLGQMAWNHNLAYSQHPVAAAVAVAVVYLSGERRVL